LIFFCCNHDHVFVDNDPIHFQKTIGEFRSNFKNELATLYFSHWPEILNLCLNKIYHGGWANSGYFSDGSCNLLQNFGYTIGNSADSVQIITKPTYHKWWFTGEFNDGFFPRTDYFGNFIPSVFPKIQAVPYREYFKHFDGYTHIHSPNVNLQELASNISCPLFIPDGFYDNKIKLYVGFDDVKDDCININLNKKNFTVIDKNGTDLKCYSEEIPFFWKKRISEITFNPDYDEKKFSQERNNSIIEPLICGLFHNTLNNYELLCSIKKTYNIEIQ
jgi:hypothetical protein